MLALPLSQRCCCGQKACEERVRVRRRARRDGEQVQAAVGEALARQRVEDERQRLKRVGDAQQVAILQVPHAAGGMGEASAVMVKQAGRKRAPEDAHASELRDGRCGRQQLLGRALAQRAQQERRVNLRGQRRGARVRRGRGRGALFNTG